VSSPVPADDTGSGGAAAAGRDVRAKLLDAVERMAGDDYKLPRLAFSLHEIAREVASRPRASTATSAARKT
jgi:hypothetical protein